MLSFIYWTAIGGLSGVVFASFFEWTLHRFLMHRPLGRLRYAYEAHALVHHRVFRADHTYHLIDEKDRATIHMAWWNGPVLISLCLLPFIAAAAIAHRWGLLCGAGIAFTVYYASYEYLHWCMHLPRQRMVERSGIFFRLNGHHLLHHRYMHKNFNVVLPLADLCLGTLLRRSPFQFKQVCGQAVPDVQPRTFPIAATTGPSPAAGA